MARMARLVIPGLPHHVTQRGVRRIKVFTHKTDSATYLDMMKESCAKAGTTILAYCLMPNHVHFVMVPSHEDGLRAALADTHRRYTRMVNLREECRGHLWQERFHSFVMDESYLLSCVKYVELNPVRAGLVEQPKNWLWSSARAHLTSKDDGLVKVKPMLELVPNWQQFLDSGMPKNHLEQIYKHKLTGRPLGPDNWIKKLEAQSGRKLVKNKPGPKVKIKS
ncbi:MAG: transposase [Kordiimonadaceae bacterium]|jgi:putative transposase|nr:transposase [Kordiimonadaceae bacterium]